MTERVKTELWDVAQPGAGKPEGAHPFGGSYVNRRGTDDKLQPQHHGQLTQWWEDKQKDAFLRKATIRLASSTGNRTLKKALLRVLRGME